MAETSLFRMDLPGHTCPSGLKLRHFLRSQKIEFEDTPLTSRADVDAAKEHFGVKTTPIFVENGEVIGGYEATREYFGDPIYKGRTYRPVLTIFAVAALLAIVIAIATDSFGFNIIPRFVALCMVLLGLQKLRDLESFSSMFLLYDLLAQRFVPYAKVYPFLETGAGLLMFAGLLTWITAPIMLVAAGIGAVSVFKAVWIDGRDLRCACTGGSTNVPLGPVSLLENVVMVVMALGMLIWG